MTATSDLSTPDAAAPPADEVGPAPGATRRSVGPLLLRLHFYAGLLVSPFLILTAVTGLLFVFSPQLDEVVYADEFGVAEVRDTPIPLAEQVRAAMAARPDGALVSVQPAEDAASSTRVVFAVPELVGTDRNDTVFVDQYTGQVRGSLVTWFGETPLMTWLDDFHRNLHLGDLGRHYSELAASWLWVVALGGLGLWWRRQRTAPRRARALLSPDLAARKGVRRTRGWHASTGVWLLVGLLVLAATGLTWSRYAGANFAAVLDAFDAGTPELNTDPSAPPAGGSGGDHHGGIDGGVGSGDPADIDTVVAVARDAGLGGLIEVSPPTGGGSTWAVAQADNVWPVGFDRVAVDPATGAVTDRSNFADWPVLAQLTKVGIAAHMGYLFGVVNQILLAALAIGLLCVVVWGYRMWWQRRPTRAGRRAPVGRPPARRAWQQAPTWAIVVGVPLAFAVGWTLPLLGVSLLVFLVFDLLAGAWPGRRRVPIPVSPVPADRRRAPEAQRIGPG